ncbi:MAG: HK97-gp10 family putative phage morphogenesis protein [Actinomycetota bacterium]
MSVHWEGLSEFKGAVDRMAVVVNAATRAAVIEAAVLVETKAKQNANTGSHRKGEPTNATPGSGPNVVTGNLRRSITHSPPVAVGGWGHAITVGVAQTAPYGEYLEHGLRNGTTYPFFEPAVREVTPQLAEIYSRAWARAIRS